MPKCNKCHEETQPHWSGRCYDCFFTLKRRVKLDSVSQKRKIGTEAYFDAENSTGVITVDNSTQFTPVVKDKINELINDVIDTTTISVGVEAMTARGCKNYMDSLKEKIRGNIICKIREL